MIKNRLQGGIMSLKIKKAFFLTLLLSLCLPSTPSYCNAKISEQKILLNNEEKVFINGTHPNALTIDESSNLNDYLTIALKNNPGIKSAFYQWKATFNTIQQAASLPDPQFTYTEYIEEVETRAGPQEKAFSLKQKIPLPDKLWIRKNKAFKESQEAFFNFQVKKLNLIYKITNAYYEYVYLHKAILLTDENIKLLQNFENVAQTKYKTALAKNQDLLKIQVELGKLENELYSLKDLRDPLTDRLTSLLNLPQNTLLPWPKDSLENVMMPEEFKDKELLDAFVMKNNPAILKTLKAVEKNQSHLKLTKRNYFPDLTIGVTHIDTKDALNPNTIGSGKDPLMVMFSIDIPLWLNRLTAETKEAKASLKASKNSFINIKNELSSKLSLIHYKLRDSLRQSYLYKDALLPKAIQALNATQSGYEGGRSDFLSLIDAQRTLLNFQLAYYRHNANYYQFAAELTSLLGKLPQNGENYRAK